MSLMAAGDRRLTLTCTVTPSAPASSQQGVSLSQVCRGFGSRLLIISNQLCFEKLGCNSTTLQILDLATQLVSFQHSENCFDSSQLFPHNYSPSSPAIPGPTPAKRGISSGSLDSLCPAYHCHLLKLKPEAPASTSALPWPRHAISFLHQVSY